MEKQKEYLAALAMPPLTARYSDGSTEEIPVVWDEKALSAVRLGSAGTYEVPGQAVVKEYDAPLVRGVADPVIRRIVSPGNRFFCAVPVMRGIASIRKSTKAPTSSSTTGNCF